MRNYQTPSSNDLSNTLEAIKREMRKEHGYEYLEGESDPEEYRYVFGRVLESVAYPLIFQGQDDDDLIEVRGIVDDDEVWSDDYQVDTSGTYDTGDEFYTLKGLLEAAVRKHKAEAHTHHAEHGGPQEASGSDGREDPIDRQALREKWQ